MIDCDQLLYGDCTFEQVQDYFRNGDFDSEEYAIEAISRHLITPTHLQIMARRQMSVADMLNGRVEGSDNRMVRDMIFSSWNNRLGFNYFH